MDGSDEEYEVITSEEVDRVLDALDRLITDAASENVRAYLEEAADNIFSLIYSDEDMQETEQDEAA